MQQRRLRPGDVLDDYCPRERRVTDHAIVAMIDDHIKQTRCVVCDAEHEYKQAKVPPQRRKKSPALFTQVLDGLQGPTRPHLPDVPDDDPDVISDEDVDIEDLAAAPVVASIAVPIPGPLSAPVATPPEFPSILASTGNGNGNADDDPPVVIVGEPNGDHDDGGAPGDVPDGPVRRKLFRAALPRPEGTPPPARVMPEFTIRQPNMNGRANRHGGGAGGRRRGAGQQQQQAHPGPMRFGRGAHGQRSQGQRGAGGQGGPGGNRTGGSRRGGKKR